MPTNRFGYNKSYYHREVIKIREDLGSRCVGCTSTSDLIIHHKIPLNGNRPSGMLNRLTEWKRNKDNLELRCKACHKEVHKLWRAAEMTHDEN